MKKTKKKKPVKKKVKEIKEIACYGCLDNYPIDELEDDFCPECVYLSTKEEY